jgi:hypothetical protein
LQPSSKDVLLKLLLVLFAISAFLAIPGHCKRPVSLPCCYVGIDESVILAVNVLGRNEVSARIVQIGELVDFDCLLPNLLPLLIRFALKLNELRKLAPPFAPISVNLSAMLQFTRPRSAPSSSDRSTVCQTTRLLLCRRATTSPSGHPPPANNGGAAAQEENRVRQQEEEQQLALEKAVSGSERSDGERPCKF